MTQPGDLPDWLTRVIGQADVILQIVGLTTGNQSAQVNVSQYQSVLISTGQVPSLAAQGVTVQWFDVNGLQICQDEYGAPADPIGIALFDVAIPVRGTTMSIFNNSGQTLTFTVMGSGRVVPGMIGAGYTDVQQLTTGNVVMTVNGIFELGGSYLGSQGWHQFDIGVTSTAVSGELLVTTASAGGVTRDIRVADTVTMHVDGTSFRQYGQLILPASMSRLRWVSRTAATYSVTVGLIALGR